MPNKLGLFVGTKTFKMKRMFIFKKAECEELINSKLKRINKYFAFLVHYFGLFSNLEDLNINHKLLQ